MYFRVLQQRLADTLRRRVRSGEFSERSLARRTRISQPHIHNILKGIRAPSPRLADAIMRELGLSLVNLFDPNELPGLGSPVAPCPTFREIPELDGLLGPDYPFPEQINMAARYPFPMHEVGSLISPVVAGLAPDPLMANWFDAGSRVLLDRSGSKRAQPVPSGLYAVLWNGQGLLRHVRVAGSHLRLIPADGQHNPAAWHSISLADRHILEVVKAKAVWIGRPLELPPVAQQSVEKVG
jgi:transcriptional regulator with XRE-family HTH domain